MEGKITNPLIPFRRLTPHSIQTFWDATGKIWTSGGYAGKHAGVFISTAAHGGGQESTPLAAMSTFAHHGIIFVPFGYSKAFPELTNLKEVHGGQ
jgi:NAD(P)H dehydrogenase (quinone)